MGVIDILPKRRQHAMLCARTAAPNSTQSVCAPLCAYTPLSQVCREVYLLANPISEKTLVRILAAIRRRAPVYYLCDEVGRKAQVCALSCGNVSERAMHTSLSCACVCVCCS